MCNRSVKIYLVFLMFFASLLSFTPPIFASTDITPPIIKSLKIDKSAVVPGDQIKIEVEAEDLESGISTERTDRVVKVQKQYGDTYQYVYLNYDASINKYIGTFTVPDNAINGVWYTSWIYFKDNVGNIESFLTREGSPFYQTFVVSNGSSDSTPPTIKSIKLDKPTVAPGDQIIIEVEAEDLDSGISTERTDRVVKVQKQYGDTYQYVYLNYDASINKYIGTFTVPDNAINGVWYTSWIYFKDNVGNIESFLTREGSPFYQTFVVSNGSSDSTPPTIKSIKLDKPTVAPGDQIMIEVEAEDLESGISTKQTDRVVKVQKQYGDTYQYVYLNYDVASNKYKGTFTVPANAINGVWVISWIYFKDNVGNIESFIPKEGSLFYQTFVVSNGSIDSTPPTVKSIKLDKPAVAPGEQIKIEVEAEDFESGISTKQTDRVVKVQKQYGDTYQYVYLNYDAASNKYTGIFTVPANAINGVWVISWIYFKDNVGNIESFIPKEGTEFYQVFTVNSDIIPPAIPMVNEVTDQSTSVTGSAEAGSTLTVRAGTMAIGSGVAGITGHYSVNIPKQKQGTSLTVTSSDKAGNVSAAKNVTVKDVTPPSVPIVNEVTDKSTGITGRAEANTLVYVKTGSTIIGRGKTNSTGTFDIVIPVQKADTAIRIVVKDTAGLYSPYTTITVKDKTAPSAPLVNSITSKQTVVTGTAEANTLVYVKAGATIIGRGKTDTAGKFAVTVPLQPEGTSIRVVVKDSAGNYSPYTTTAVLDKTAPLAPLVNAITNKATVVTGTAEENTLVYVKAGATIIGRGKTDTTGKFAVTISMQPEGTSIRVVVKDSAGNYSPYTTVKVISK